MRTLEAKEIKELLSKGWMTHDGMWFLHTLQQCGIDKANQINLAAVSSMAQVEIKRMAKALDVEQVNSLTELQEFCDAAFGIVKADFMDFSFHFTPQGVLRFDMHQCFAHKGINRMGVIDQYQCGILERIESWFKAMGIRFSVTPQVQGCMMHREGNCYREYVFDF